MIVEKAIRTLIKLIFNTDFPENAKVFEIGSGEGFNSKFMQDLGYEVTAGDVPKDFIEAGVENGFEKLEFQITLSKDNYLTIITVDGTIDGKYFK